MNNSTIQRKCFHEKAINNEKTIRLKSISIISSDIFAIPQEHHSYEQDGSFKTTEFSDDNTEDKKIDKSILVDGDIFYPVESLPIFTSGTILFFL